MAHFWIVLSVPSSHVRRVTLEKVRGSLEKGLEETASCNGYLLHLPLLSVSGESKRGTEGRAECVCVSKMEIKCVRGKI